jgi:hypothetical protein
LYEKEISLMKTKDLNDLSNEIIKASALRRSIFGDAL